MVDRERERERERGGEELQEEVRMNIDRYLCKVAATMIRFVCYLLKAYLLP